MSIYLKMELSQLIGKLRISKKGMKNMSDNRKIERQNYWKEKAGLDL